jgi:hypothetical protein
MQLAVKSVDNHSRFKYNNSIGKNARVVEWYTQQT